MANQYNLNIAGYSLVVKTKRSAVHMERLAETLNERVREIQQAGSTTNYLNVVMLAAMELADDVLSLEGLVSQARKENRELEERVLQLEAQARVLTERLERGDEDISFLRAEVDALKKEKERLQEKYERRSRDLLDALDNVLK